MKNKTIPLLIAFISASSIVLMMWFFNQYQFAKWAGFFFAMPLIYSMTALVDIEVSNNEKPCPRQKLWFGTLIGVVFILLFFRQGFTLISLAQLLSLIAGGGVVWLLWQYIHPKSEDNQQQVIQRTNKITKAKTILMLTAIISLAALAFLGIFLGHSSFPEWLSFFFAVIFIYALFMRFNILDVLHNSKAFFITAFCLVVTVAIQSIRDFNLISAYQILSTIAGLGVVWLLIQYIRPKDEETQQQTEQTTN